MIPGKKSSNWSLITDDLYYLNAEFKDNRYWLNPSYFIKHILDGKHRTISELIELLWRLEPERLTKLITDINRNNGIIYQDVAIERKIDEPGRYKIADGHHRVVSAVALNVPIPIIIFSRSRKLQNRD